MAALGSFPGLHLSEGRFHDRVLCISSSFADAFADDEVVDHMVQRKCLVLLYSVIALWSGTVCFSHVLVKSVLPMRVSALPAVG